MAAQRSLEPLVEVRILRGQLRRSPHLQMFGGDPGPHQGPDPLPAFMFRTTSMLRAATGSIPRGPRENCRTAPTIHVRLFIPTSPHPGDIMPWLHPGTLRILAVAALLVA